MKGMKWLGLALLCTIVFVGCGTKTAPAATEEIIKPVKVMVVEQKTVDTTLDYIGIVGINPTHNLAYKVGGILLTVDVVKGQDVQKGMLLATLDTKEMQLGVEAANAQINAAKAQYAKAEAGASEEDLKNAKLDVDKAQSAYDYMIDQFEKMKTLLAEGVVSQSEVDQLVLQKTVQEMSLKQAKEVYAEALKGAEIEDLQALQAQIDQAQINLESKEMMIQDATLISDVDGVVLDVLYEKGEMVGAGYPVIVIASHEQVVKVGVTGEDLDKIAVGTTAMLSGGTVVSTRYISDVPDTTTLTYEVEMAVPAGGYNLGELLDVSFVVGESTGIWIPLNTVLSEGKDFVMVEKDGEAVKTEVLIEESRGTDVRVSGLTVGDKLINEGIHKLNDGDAVAVGE